MSKKIEEKTVISPVSLVLSKAFSQYIQSVKDKLTNAQGDLDEFKKQIDKYKDKNASKNNGDLKDLDIEIPAFKHELEVLKTRAVDLLKKFMTFSDPRNGKEISDQPTITKLQDAFIDAINGIDSRQKISDILSKKKTEAKAQDIAQQMKQKGFKYVVSSGDKEGSLEFAKDARDAAEKLKKNKNKKLSVQTLENYIKKQESKVKDMNKQISEIKTKIGKRVMNDLGAKKISEVKIDDIAAYIARSEANEERAKVMLECATKNEKKIWESAFQKVR